MKRGLARYHRFNRYRASVIAALLGGWCLLSASGYVGTYFLPSPAKVGEAFVELLSTGDYLRAVAASLWRVFAAMVLAIMLALPLALLMTAYRGIDALVEPVLSFFRYLPISGFIPLSILWLGVDEVQKVGVLFLGIFMQLAPMAVDATRNTKTEMIDSARVLGASRINIVLAVVMPSALPGMLDAIRISFGVGWTYVVLAELVASGRGIGHTMAQAQRYLRTDFVFVGIITIGLLGLVIDMILRLVGRSLFSWQDMERVG